MSPRTKRAATVTLSRSDALTVLSTLAIHLHQLYRLRRAVTAELAAELGDDIEELTAIEARLRAQFHEEAGL